MKDFLVARCTNDNERSTFLRSLRYWATRETSNSMEFQSVLARVPFTPEEYGDLLCSSVNAPVFTSQRWSLIYQAAEKHGIHPNTEGVVQQLAEQTLFFKRDQLSACVQMLQDRDIPLDAPDEGGMTPLMHAFRTQYWCSTYDFKHMAFWLEVGARVDARDPAGNTLLHLAGEGIGEERRHIDALEGYNLSILFLLKQGVDIMACNQEGLVAHEAVRKKLSFMRKALEAQRMKIEARAETEVYSLIGNLERALDEVAVRQALSLVPQRKEGRPRV